MATRSAIGYASPRGYVTAVYCHWSGYPEHQVPILTRQYFSKSKVVALIKPGSMSSLETTQTWDPEVTRNPQPLYHAERGQGPWCDGSGSYAAPPYQSRSIQAAISYWREFGCEHLYVLLPGCGWQHYPL
jgi:hypothetical protein